MTVLWVVLTAWVGAAIVLGLVWWGAKGRERHPHTTITTPGAAFTRSDKGQPIYSPGLPDGLVIHRVISPTQCVVGFPRRRRWWGWWRR